MGSGRIELLLYPPLEGEGRLLEQSESSRGGVKVLQTTVHSTPLASLATLPLQGRVKKARNAKSNEVSP